MVTGIFDNITHRVLLRPTNRYAMLLNTSLHPDFMGNYVSRKVLLNRIGLQRIGRGENEVLVSEVNQLLKNQIPIFYAKSSEKSIFDNEGQEIPNMLEDSPMNMVIRKINELNEQNLLQQLDFIDSSFAHIDVQRDRDLTSFNYGEQNEEKANADSIRQTVNDIGNHLLDLGSLYDSNQGIAWVTNSVSEVNENVGEVVSVGKSFYSGNSGISFFLLNLAKATKETKFFIAAQRSAHNFKKNKKSNNEVEGVRSLGFYTGLSGEIFVTYELYRTFHNENYLKFLEIKLQKLLLCIKVDNSFDIIDGLAVFLASRKCKKRQLKMYADILSFLLAI